MPQLSSVASIAGTRAFAAMNSNAVAFGLMFAGEIVSIALAKSGNAGLAGYFGTGADPLIDLFELSNRDDLRASNDAEEVQLFLYDALLYTGQAVLNVLTSPVSTVLNFLQPQDPNTNIGWNGNVGSMSWEYKTDRGVYENRTLSIIGTNKNDVLQAPLYVNGGGGDDIILGRMNRNDEKYIAYINNIADAIFFINGGTAHANAFVATVGGGRTSLQSMSLSEIMTAFDNGSFSYPGLSQGFTNTQGWRDFFNRYRFELEDYFDSGRGTKTAIDHLTNYELLGFNTQLRGGEGHDKIYSRYDTDIYGDGGNDYIKANYYAKYVDGGTGDDVIVLDANHDSSYAAANTYSYPTVQYYDYAFHTYQVQGGTGHDHLVLNGLYSIQGYRWGTDVFIDDDNILFRVSDKVTNAYSQVFRDLTINGFEQLSIYGDNAANFIRADGATMDLFVNGGAEADHIFGSQGINVLQGGHGWDTLTAQDADDVLIGGYGSDTLTGGGGADVFVIDTYEGDSLFADVITDFSLVEGDIIAINTEAFGHLTENDLVRFEYRRGLLKFDGNIIVDLFDDYATDFSDFELRFGKDIIFTNFYQNAPDPTKTTLNGTVANGYIQGATVFLDSNFNLQLDEGEASTVTNLRGEYQLNFNIDNFDSNGNGIIDADEAQIVAIGGTDVTTGLELVVPLITHATEGAIATPTTTIKASLEALGLTGEEANSILTQTLGLNVANLDEFDPYEAQGNEYNEGVNTALAHILFHSIIINGTAFLEGVGYTGNAAQILTQVIAEEINSGEEVNLEDADEIAKIFTLALESAGIDTVSTEKVTNVSKLIGTLNDFMEELLENEEPDEDDDNEPSVSGKLTNINPVKHILLGELVELTTQLSQDEITLEQALDSLDNDLREIGFKLMLENEYEEGAITTEYEVTLVETPEIHLDNSIIDENEPLNTEIGTLTTVSPDINEIFTYDLISGEEDTDNHLFTLEGNTLKTNSVFDYETKDSYIIEVQTTDSTNNSYTQSFLINVNDVNEAPIVNEPISNQMTEVDTPFNFTLSEDTFSDVDDDSLTYSATLSDGNMLPDWLEFDSETATFNGNPTEDNLGKLSLKVIASDSLNETVESEFILTVFNQIIEGSNSNNVMEGTDANDYLNGHTGRDNLVGGDGDDEIVGGVGADMLTGGNGEDTFIYNSIRERGDRLTDFNVDEDTLDFSGLLNEFNYMGSDAVGDGYISWGALGSHTMVNVDSDGSFGRSRSTPYILLLDVDATTVTTDNFVV